MDEDGGRDKLHRPERNGERGWEEGNPRAPGRPKEEGKGGTLPPTSSHSENFFCVGMGLGRKVGLDCGKDGEERPSRPQVGLGWGALNSPG